MMVEFSFDVIQVAGGGYLPQSYHDFIGFQVSKDLLRSESRLTPAIILLNVSQAPRCASRLCPLG
jgi:hypothetical protein